MRQTVSSRWFTLAGLILVLLCGVIWYFYPQVGGWLVIIAIIPWIVRSLARLSPIRFTKFDPALLIFLFTAIVAVWATYDPDTGLAKFWLIIGSILLYYALVGQPRANLWAVVGLIALVGASVALYFLLSHDWQTQSADTLLIHQAGMWWMNARPLTITRAIHPNIAGGLLAMFLPFYVVLSMRAWRKQSITIGIFVFLTGMVSVAGLFMTSSRAAWLALAIGLGIWLLWGLSSYLARIVPLDRRFNFGVVLLVAIVIGSLIILQYPGGLVGLTGSLPGSDSTVSRLEIAGNTVKLIADFPFTGGGLASFPGLYSQYMMITPFFLFSYSHNMYLDIALEQGIIGLLVYLVVLGGTVWQLGKGKRYRRIRWAIFVSLLVVVIHGFADDPLYGIQGTPFLFLLSGITVVATRSRKSPQTDDQSTMRLKRRTWLRNGIVVGLPLLVFISFALGGIVLANWYANLGAVDMARVELQDFPSGIWQEYQNLDALNPAIETFNKSLRLDGGNFTAQYRMGMIAMQARDFVLAKSYLEPAIVVDSEHRGVRKVLGYCYVWLGEFDKAIKLLSDIPEARGELRVYTGWWEKQGRQDLAENAEQMVEILGSMGTVVNQQ
jgi:O-antigen ligase